MARFCRTFGEAGVLVVGRHSTMPGQSPSSFEEARLRESMQICLLRPTRHVRKYSPEDIETAQFEVAMTHDAVISIQDMA